MADVDPDVQPCYTYTYIYGVLIVESELYAGAGNTIAANPTNW